MRSQPILHNTDNTKEHSMSGTPTKNISLKFIASDRPLEQLGIEPGTSVADCLQSVGLPGGGFVLTDPQAPDHVYRGADDLYARATEGQLFAVGSAVDAGDMKVIA